MVHGPLVGLPAPGVHIALRNRKSLDIQSHRDCTPTSKLAKKMVDVSSIDERLWPAPEQEIIWAS